MTLSRKDFFRQSIYSLGKTVLSVGETVREAQASLCGSSEAVHPESATGEEPERAPRPGESGGAEPNLPPLQGLSAKALAKAEEGRGLSAEGRSPKEGGDGVDLVARVDNRHCMAKNCGCFSCLERCEAGAISLVLGEGIAIDATLCTGCGDCCNICPLAPQALALVTRG